MSLCVSHHESLYCVCFLTSREEDERILQQCVRSELHALALLRCRLLLLTHVVASQSYREGKVRQLGQVPMYLNKKKKKGQEIKPHHLLDMRIRLKYHNHLLRAEMRIMMCTEAHTIEKTDRQFRKD